MKENNVPKLYEDTPTRGDGIVRSCQPFPIKRQVVNILSFVGPHMLSVTYSSLFLFLKQCLKNVKTIRSLQAIQNQAPQKEVYLKKHGHCIFDLGLNFDSVLNRLYDFWQVT